MDMTIRKPKVLFLDLENCTGSQIAEAYLNYLAADLFEAFSAGIEPHELNPAAVLVMDEVEIDISRHYCKNVEAYLTFHFKFVITLGELARSRCPMFHWTDNFQHWHFRNMPTVRGPLQAELEEIRNFRDEIKHKVWELISFRF